MAPRRQSRAAERAELPFVRIDDPAFLVFAVPDCPGGRLSPHDRDLLGAARLLADEGGGASTVAVFGAMPGGLGEAGADRVLAFVGESFARYAPEARAAALVAAMVRHGPRHVLFPESPWGGADLGRRVATRLGERAAAHVRRLEGGRALSLAEGGTRDLWRPLPRIALLAAEVAEPVRRARHEARLLETPAVACKTTIRDLGELAFAPGEIALDEAELILAAGRGVTDWNAFHRLAAALAASEAGSRVVVDEGHLSSDRQVGVSGAEVSPRCYLALGISGAAQHLQGMTACERVIAVSIDRHCEMVRRADLAVIGDAQAIMAALLDLLDEDAGNG